MSSIMRRRSGEILSDESFMALLRLRNEADCLTSQHTKQNLRDQPPADPGSKPPLPRERFSPSTPRRRWRSAAFRHANPVLHRFRERGLREPRSETPSALIAPVLPESASSESAPSDADKACQSTLRRDSWYQDLRPSDRC